jgi:hypothetical protein
MPIITPNTGQHNADWGAEMQRATTQTHAAVSAQTTHSTTGKFLLLACDQNG